MSRRPSGPLYVGELVPDCRQRGHRAHSEKLAREGLRRVTAVESVAREMIINGLSRKEAVAVVARKTHRNDEALCLLFKQNRDSAILSVAQLLKLKDPNSPGIARAHVLLDQGERRRRARR